MLSAHTESFIARDCVVEAHKCIVSENVRDANCEIGECPISVSTTSYHLPKYPHRSSSSSAAHPPIHLPANRPDEALNIVISRLQRQQGRGILRMLQNITNSSIGTGTLEPASVGLSGHEEVSRNGVATLVFDLLLPLSDTGIRNVERRDRLGG